MENKINENRFTEFYIGIRVWYLLWARCSSRWIENRKMCRKIRGNKMIQTSVTEYDSSGEKMLCSINKSERRKLNQIKVCTWGKCQQINYRNLFSHNACYSRHSSLEILFSHCVLWWFSFFSLSQVITTNDVITFDWKQT